MIFIHHLRVGQRNGWVVCCVARSCFVRTESLQSDIDILGLVVHYLCVCVGGGGGGRRSTEQAWEADDRDDITINHINRRDYPLRSRKGAIVKRVFSTFSAAAVESGGVGSCIERPRVGGSFATVSFSTFSNDRSALQSASSLWLCQPRNKKTPFRQGRGHATRKSSQAFSVISLMYSECLK